MIMYLLWFVQLQVLADIELAQAMQKQDTASADEVSHAAFFSHSRCTYSFNCLFFPISETCIYCTFFRYLS